MVLRVLRGLCVRRLEFRDGFLGLVIRDGNRNRSRAPDPVPGPVIVLRFIPEIGEPGTQDADWNSDSSGISNSSGILRRLCVRWTGIVFFVVLRDLQILRLVEDCVELLLRLLGLVLLRSLWVSVFPFWQKVELVDVFLNASSHRVRQVAEYGVLLDKAVNINSILINVSII